MRNNFEIHFFSPDRSPGEKGAITDRLLERGIILDDGYEPTEFLDGGMADKDGTFRKADLVLYSPAITGPLLVQKSCLPMSIGGHIDVDKYGQVKGLPHVFAAGDCANHENPPPWVPHQAHMAQLRASAAAKNMKAILNGMRSTNLYRQELSCILDMQNDAMWLHKSEDGRPPFRNIFPRRSKNLIFVKEAFEQIFLFYLRYL